MNGSLPRIFALIVSATLISAGANAQDKPATPPKDEPTVKPANTRESPTGTNRTDRKKDADRPARTGDATRTGADPDREKNARPTGSASLRDRPTAGKAADSDATGAIIQEPSQGRPIF